MTVEDVRNYLKEKERILHNEYIKSIEDPDSLALSRQVDRARFKLMKEIIDEINAMEGES